MIKVLVNGCNGKMGQIVTNLLEQDEETLVFGGFDREESDLYTYHTFTDFSQILEKPDVIIDFSVPVASVSMLNFARMHKIPMVIATTGFREEEKEIIKQAAKEIAIFQSSNMSFDIQLMGKIVAEVAAILNNTDIEIVETHHHRKIDSPSGTALLLAEKINEAKNHTLSYNLDRMQKREKRKPSEIGFSSIRGGNIVGEHSVKFFGENETLEITHTAHSREIFAEGAIKAAKFLVNQPAGFYTMDDLV